MAFTLAGMIIEPFSNYADKYIFRWILGWAGRQKDKHSAEEQLLEDDALRDDVREQTKLAVIRRRCVTRF